ncbi:hypothetical protein [Paraburkholderia rhynchosiae]|uniref:Lipoprotein n=1 Tax=Paraburkholderia rhynchosiae TaxID=487049 RepID=A0A6J5AXD9_9BURK|nr:hypothetical protein [Paraburkholderia rhynchosiae]CAB3682167.1 hypothetical protein LMG27174_02724 [Paraburkholderia rhynchosiae]
MYRHTRLYLLAIAITTAGAVACAGNSTVMSSAEDKADHDDDHDKQD